MLIFFYMLPLAEGQAGESWKVSTRNASNIKECCLFSFGWFPGVWFINADVTEHPICSIFKGRWFLVRAAKFNICKYVVSIRDLCIQEKYWSFMLLLWTFRVNAGKTYELQNKQVGGFSCKGKRSDFFDGGKASAQCVRLYRNFRYRRTDVCVRKGS